jgi:hypothetical protein
VKVASKTGVEIKISLQSSSHQQAFHEQKADFLEVEEKLSIYLSEKW